MSISQPFIHRPIATSLLMVGLLIFGLAAYNLLPVAALPNVDFPTISVTAALPGASPETMASSVATPLEQQFAAISGLDQMTSTSGLGSTSITLQFALNRNIDGAAQDVQTAINAASGVLPKNLPNPPTYKKVNPADRAILIYAVHSDTLPIYKVDDFAELILAEKISTVAGVSQVDVAGQQKFAVRVQVNPDALAGRGIGLEDVRNALLNTSTDQPKGNLENAHQALTLDTNDQLFNADAFNKVIVAYRNGAPVRIKDIGNAIDSVELNHVGAWYDDSQAILLLVRREAGANTVATVDHIKALMEELRASVPPHRQGRPRLRPHAHHPRLGRRCPLHAAAHRRPRRHGDLSLPAQALGDHHPGDRRAALDRRHLPGHVHAGLQPRQPLAHGTDDRRGIRRRRRHRHDREHRPLHRGRRDPAAGGAQGRRADRLHHHLDHLLAHRRVHPADLHERHHRAPLPRIRHDGDDLGAGLGAGVADA